MECQRCILHKTRVNIVQGRGNQNARILIIGEAPGKSEDVLGTAFIGEAGKLLDTLLQRAGIPIDECFFTNTVLCRPCDKRSGDGREPLESEILACLPNVSRVVEILSNLQGLILAGKIAKKWYGTRLKSIPQVHIIHPSAILKMGGTNFSGYRDNLNALREFYDKLPQ